MGLPPAKAIQAATEDVPAVTDAVHERRKLTFVLKLLELVVVFEDVACLGIFHWRGCLRLSLARHEHSGGGFRIPSQGESGSIGRPEFYLPWLGEETPLPTCPCRLPASSR